MRKLKGIRRLSFFLKDSQYGCLSNQETEGKKNKKVL